jgi:uncharacterized membrane protein
VCSILPCPSRCSRGFLPIGLVALTIVYFLPIFASAQGFQIGFDFRNTSTFVTDPPGDTYVLSTTAYPTTDNGVTYGWVNTSLVQARDRSTSVDPRLAGMNFVSNGSPATFYVNLPSAGTYNLSLALGDDGYEQCVTQCQIQFLDGSTVLATVTGGPSNAGYFYDAKGNNWSAAAWPTSNLSQQVTLAGTQLTMVLGTNKATGDNTPIAFLGVAQVSGPPNFKLSASPASLSVQQGNQGTSTITTAISGGFNSAISLSASGMPSGTTVSFNPSTIPAPGSGSSTMTITVGASTPTGTYPITVTGNGGGIQQTATVTLTVTTGPNFTLSASPASLSVQQGNQGTSTITTAISGGFNGAISLSASGMPSGTTVSFNPSTIPAPGSGSSTMTITVGASTPTGTYPITVTGSGGGLQQNTTVTLTVTSSSGWGIGFDFRNTSTFVTDPPGDTYVLSTTAFPSTFDGVTFGWASISPVQARDRSTGVDPRLAGINYVSNGSPATFYVMLPSAGKYNLSLALGDDGYEQCVTQCQIQFLDGSTVLATVTGGPTYAGYFYDATGKNWSAAAWPASNLSQQVTLAGTKLTMVVGTSKATGDNTPIAFLGVTQVSGSGLPNFTLSASPASLSIGQGNQGTSSITTTISGGFNSAISLSASGVPSGTTVSFNPSTIPAPGAGSSTMTITVGASTPTGTYPITVAGNGGGIQQTATVTLTVTAGPNFTLSASPASLSVQQGNQGTSTITTTVIGGFNSAISLSASGVPSGTTVSFNPSTIPAPGAGSSTMTITVGASTAAGTYPITVTGNGGGIQQNTTVTLTVTALPSFTLSASPASVSIQQGNQGTSTITTTISGGFNNAITLSASGVPSGTTVSFNPSTLPAPGSGSSTMTITVGASTPTGTYPITVTGSGGGIQQNTTVTLTVLSSSTWAVGFDFRASSNYVEDPAGDTYVLPSTAYPTPFNGVNFGWTNVSLVQGRNRSTGVDPRLAGTNFTSNGSPATFYVGLPASGTYNLTLALGDDGYMACSVQCQIQFLDGSTVLGTLTKGSEGAGYFYDAHGNNWSAAKWPSNNLSWQVAIVGTQLTMVVGSNQGNGDDTPIAFLGVTTVTLAPNFLVSAYPTSLSIAQGNQITSTITTNISGGFNNPISLSASGLPSGATASFNPNPIPAPGAGNSTMTITAGWSTPIGTYPITVTAIGGGVQQTATVTLTVTASGFILTASPPTVTVAQGSAGNTTVETTLVGSFNSAISLTASGVPSGTTVSFNPNQIPAPGGGTSTMAIMVGANTPLGTYPITVTGNGGGIQQSFTVTLMVVSSVWQQGFDFRGSLNFVNDPPGAAGIISNTIFPTVGGLTTYGWSYTAAFEALNRNSAVDPRLAGTNDVNNGTPGQFYVDLPAPGTYSLSLAMGDDGYQACFVQCQVQFLDGSTVLSTMTGGPINMGYFYDAQGNMWSAAQWPANNVSKQVTLTGTQLTVLVGSNQDTGDYTSIAYVGVSQVSTGPTFALQAPPSVSVGQGQYSTADVFTVLIGGFNSAVSLSATGGPAGTTVSFSPSTIPAPGAGTSTMTVSVPNNAPLGNYPLTVTAKGGGIVQNMSVVLTVTTADPPSFTLTAPSAVNIGTTGGKVTGTILTTVSDGFNSAVSLSATGGPSGTTVSFNPSTIPAPGSGNSIMSVNVPAGAALGSYPITVNATSGQGNQTATVTLTVSASGNINLPSGTGWVSLSNELSFCNVSPGYTYYNPEVGAVDAFDFLSYCESGEMITWGGGAADTTNERYFLWTSGHNNYQGNEMYELNLQGASPTVSRITDPAWTVDNTDVPPDCACKGTNNCGQGLWHDGAGNPVSSPYYESGNGGPLFESVPAPDGSDSQPSCGYGTRFTPNAREIYAGMVYHASVNKLFTWGGGAAANPSGLMLSNWTLDLSQNPAAWTRLKDSSYRWFTAAAYDYTVGHSTSGSDLVFDENKTLYAYNSSTDTYTVLANKLPYIGYNTNLDLDPVHHYLIMENGDNNDGYHLRILNIDSCNGTSCQETNLDSTASCAGALGYWVGVTWDSKRNVMALFPSSENCSGPACTPPFNTAYLLNPDPNNPVTITYQGQQQTIQPQQCFAASYGPTPPTSLGPGVYSRFKYYPNEDIYLYIPTSTSLWILRLEQ